MTNYEPAFPHPSGQFNEGHPGMTLRDWFAGQVIRSDLQLIEDNGNEYQAMSRAKWAYMVADAMLSARGAA